MNLAQIINTFARSALWQLARRSPTWLLIAAVVLAALVGSHHR